MTQAVDVAELTLATEDLLRPFPREAERAGKRTTQLDYLRNVIVVFAVFGAGLGVEEVVSRYELEYLYEPLGHILLEF